MAGIGAPWTRGIQPDISLPMLLRFGIGIQLLANESQIVARVGMVRVETHGLPEMLPRCFELADFLEHTTQIEVGQSVFAIQGKSALEVLGSLLQIPALIVQRSAIQECINPLRIGLQSTVIGFDRFGLRFFAGFISQRQWLANHRHCARR